MSPFQNIAATIGTLPGTIVMNFRAKLSAFSVVVTAMFSVTMAACSEPQPAFECAARNHELYQVRYYQQSSNCTADAGFFTGSLYGGTAGLETYMLVSDGGRGGPNVSFRDDPGSLDRSATKLGIRLNALVSAEMPAACDNNLANNCAAPDSDFACKYCVIGVGGPGATYTLPDGGAAEDTPTPDGGKQGLSMPLADGGSKRISLANTCVPGRKDDVTRESSPVPDANLFLMLPRVGIKDVCSPIEGGIAISAVKFPSYSCSDGTALEEVTIATQLTDFKIVASARIPGTLAKGTLTFVENRSSGAVCKSVYKAVFLNPQVECLTDVDCSPDAVPSVARCKNPKPATSENCYTGVLTRPGTGASNLNGSGLSPFLFGKAPDGGYNVRGTCDPVMKFCIWDADAGI